MKDFQGTFVTKYPKFLSNMRVANANDYERSIYRVEHCAVSESDVGDDLILASIQRHPQQADRGNSVDHVGKPAEIG